MSTEQLSCACGPECPRALAAEQARDQAQAARDYERNGWLICTKMRLHAEQRATRLGALEAAARAYVAFGTGGPILPRIREGQSHWAALKDAIAALDAD